VLSSLGVSWIAEFFQDRGFATSTFSPADFQLQPATLADLSGGDRNANAEIVRRLLRGQERGPRRDVILLNAGAAFLVAGKTKSLTEGWELAAEVIESGKAAAKLETLAHVSR
jgi:anthranilate phosphoribosyltransferase